MIGDDSDSSGNLGFGGSILWFGSSAGVAVATLFPEAKAVVKWLRKAWDFPPAFLVGIVTQLASRGWTS